MLGLYAAPASGFVQVYPVRDLGPDLAVALHLAGVPSDALPAARLVDWVALGEDMGRPVSVRLGASSLAEARIAALPFARLCPVVLCSGVARGRVALYERRERLAVLTPGEASREDGLALVAPGAGVLVAKALNPRNARDLRVLASQLANQLTPLDYQAARGALEAGLQRLDVNWPALSPAESKRVWAAADKALKGVLKTAHGEMLPSYVQRISVALEDVAKATKRALHETYLPRIGTSLEQRDVRAVRQIALQQGWWVRDEWGVRSDRLTRDGQKIVQRGLAQGLGRDEIGRDLRQALPDMWQKYGQSYARMNAGMATARARSFSEVASYQEAGIASYEIVAIIDERTTDICRALDGQIISTNRAAALLQQQMSLAKPEDIRDVAPLCREVERDGKRYVETAHGAEIAEVQRSGYGVKDDRGTNSYSRMGDQLADASVGMPPYHMNCRTLTVPRNDMPAVQVGQVPVAASVTPPAPPALFPARGAGAVPLRPVDVLPAPRPGLPTLHGTASLLDQALLPEAFGGIGPSPNLWADDAAFAVRRWSGSSADAALAPRYSGPFDTFGKRSDEFADRLNALAREPGLLPPDDAPILADLYYDAKKVDGFGWMNQETMHASAVLARDDIGAREILLRVKDQISADGLYVRTSGALVPSKERAEYLKALDEYVLRVQQVGSWTVEAQAAVKNLKKAADDLVVAVEKSAAGKYGIKLDDVAATRYDRVNAWTPEAEPLRRLKPYKAKPPKPTPEIPAPVPVPPASDVPPLKPGRGAANRPVTPDLWNVRPALEQSNRAQWYGRGGYYSTAAANPKTGEAIGRSAWREVPERRLPGSPALIPDFGKMRLSATDHVVNVEVASARLPIRADGNPLMADIWKNAVRGELERGYRGVREYVLRDSRGVSHFIRYDGAAWADEYFANPRAVDQWFNALGSGGKVVTYPVTGGSKAYSGKGLRTQLEKGGNVWTTDVRQFYKRAEIDWTQPGLVAGVPVEEQVAARVKQVKAQLRTKIDDAVLKARAEKPKDEFGLAWLTREEDARVVARVIREELEASAGTTSVAEAAQWDMAQTKGASAAVRKKAGEASVSYEAEKAAAVLVERSVAEHIMEDAMRHASDRLRQQVQRRWAPRFVNVPKQSRAYQRGVDTFSENGRVAGVVMDLDPFLRVYPATGRAAAGFRVDTSVLNAGELAEWRVMHHEMQHWIDDLGVHREVLSIVRRDSCQSGCPVINITTDAAGNKVKEVYLPGRTIDAYEMRVYGAELRAIEKAGLANKGFHEADRFRRALEKVLPDEAGVGEIFSMTAQRIAGTDKGLLNAWETNPDQVSAYISLMRGHFVP